MKRSGLNCIKFILILILTIYSVVPVPSTTFAGEEKSNKRRPVVVLDQSHGQHFDFWGTRALDLSVFRQELEKAGAVTRVVKSGFSDENVLRGSSSVVISGAFVPLGDSEVQNLLKLVNSGGRLLILLHIGQPYYKLLDRLGISVSNGVIRERQNVLGSGGLDFQVMDLTSMPLLKGLGHFSVYGCWALLPRGRDVVSIARTSPAAWVDLNRNRRLDGHDVVRAFSVAVKARLGKGEVIVFGDDAIFQNAFLRGRNLELSKRVANWLIGKRPFPQELERYI